MPHNSSFKFGSDPEFILRKRDTKEIVSAEGLLGGTKEQAVPFTSQISFLEDGVCLEINSEPYSSWNLSSYLSVMGSRIRQLEDNLLIIKGLEIVPVTEADFDPKYLATAGTLAIGCSPDMCAYDTEVRNRPNLTASEFGNTRFAGGHIHFGIDPWPVELPKSAFVKLLDFTLGVPMKHLFPQSTKRSKFYGLAGLYRDKPYGVEYRSLSNLPFIHATTDYDPFHAYAFSVLSSMIQTIVTFNAGQDSGELAEAYHKINWRRLRAYLNQDNVFSEDWPAIWEEYQEFANRFGGVADQALFAPIKLLTERSAPPPKKKSKKGDVFVKNGLISMVTDDEDDFITLTPPQAGNGNG